MGAEGEGKHRIAKHRGFSASRWTDSMVGDVPAEQSRRMASPEKLLSQAVASIW